ncbi:phage antirepressor KilAC domain-containing protein [Acinetobacter soli]|uniref:phage antirepressor KilAC domain-containing protein n=1 Tax=Acinetobacter soli TaxID=487316 RepID=UPI002D80A176|nr:phage antirepressor KilAC domain-containing protein [Acinetobacter soli]MEB4800572.1 phage antirepressor KilAC domain-containing protein [Acinetobacter soli]
MNMLAKFNHTEMQMTSLEISELVRSRHDSVKRTIETLASKGVIESPQSVEIKTATRPTGAYVFSGEAGKLDSITVVAQLCPQFTAALVKRWYELESQQNQTRELTRLEILQLALESEKKAIELEQQVKVLEPKAQALDVIADTTNTYSIRECAKTIGIQETKLIDFMLKKQWVYRENSRHRRLCAYAHRVEQKVMINKVSKVVACDDGDKVFTQARITAFGLTRLTAAIEKAGLV